MDQRIVESSDIVVAIWMSRERFFNRMTSAEQKQVIAWMLGWHYLLWTCIDGDRRPDHRQLVLDRGRSFIEGFLCFFGGYTHSHPWFDWINAESRNSEIKASAGWFQNVEPGPWAFAYPYGGLSEDLPRLLQAHGFTAAFTTDTQLRHPNPYFIGRLDGEEILQDGRHYA
jgi:hypothetical protein